MKEFWARLFAKPALAVELITASLFISILALASPLFSMQVLNRYVSQGVDATLITLTIGVLIAIALELAFREARMALADRVSAKPDEDIAASSYDVLTRARLDALERVPADMRREILAGINSVEQAYNASNISAVLDVPFALLFIFVLAVLSPMIASIVALFMAAVFVGGLLAQVAVQKQTTELTNASGKTSTLMSTAIRESETVRVFNASGFLRKAWTGHTRFSHALRRLAGTHQPASSRYAVSSTWARCWAPISSPDAPCSRSRGSPSSAALS